MLLSLIPDLLPLIMKNAIPTKRKLYYDFFICKCSHSIFKLKLKKIKINKIWSEKMDSD